MILVEKLTYYVLNLLICVDTKFILISKLVTFIPTLQDNWKQNSQKSIVFVISSWYTFLLIIEDRIATHYFFNSIMKKARLSFQKNFDKLSQ